MAVTHKHATGFKKGDNIMLEGEPCKVTNISVSRPGKHGHAKVRIEAVGLVDEKKRQYVAPGHDDIDVPIIEKKNAQVLSVSGDKANVMDMETYVTFDLAIPEELKGEVEEGKTIHYHILPRSSGEYKIMRQVRD